MQFGELLKGTACRLLQGSDQTEIRGIAYDSRKVQDGFLFVCMRGATVDGHRFAASAAEKGAAALIVEERDADSAGKLEDAVIVVAGGRGMGSEENFRDLYDLADILGASVAATRAAVFHGWAEESQQVGISAKSVAPKLYIACGISGATQHVDGMSRAEHVLSINLNSTAPYVGEADLSVVGNARSIVKKLVAALK